MLRDKIRTERIEAYNLAVIRIPNNEISSNFRGVCEYIDKLVKESLHRSGGPPPFNKGGFYEKIEE